MIDKIKSLEISSRKLEPSNEERNYLIDRSRDYANEFLNRLHNPELSKAYFKNDDYGAGIYDLPISEEPGDFEKIISIIKEQVDKAGINPASGGHLGYIPGGGLFPSSIGDFLAAVTNRYAGVFFASPGAVRMENFLIRWLCDIFGFPENSSGNLTSGGSTANLIGIVTARDSRNLKAKDFDKAVIYLSEYVHHSIDKAIRIAGLNDSIKRYVPTDEKFIMNAEALSELIGKDKKNGLNPFLIIACVGTTDTGAIDPISEISEIACKNNLWLHVDAAYGGFFILCEEGRKAIKDMDKADSIVIDPHKGLFLPYGIGAIIVKDKNALLKSHHYQANYMQDTLRDAGELSPGELSPEFSKHFRGLRMWLPILYFGLKPFRDSLEEKIWLTRYFYEELKKDERFELGPYPELSIAFFRYTPKSGDADEFNKRLINEIQNDGRVFLSSTLLNGKFYIRIAVLSFRTHLETIDLGLKILKEKVEMVERSIEVLP